MVSRTFVFTAVFPVIIAASLQVSAMTIGEAKSEPDNTSVTLSGKVISSPYGALPYRVYIEEPDRSAGIQVYIAVASYPDLTEGKLVDVSGIIYTQSTGERAIKGASFTIVGQQGPLKPLSMVNKTLGGAEKGLQTGVLGGLGLNNVGLLVQGCGWVTFVDAGNTYAKLDDGSGNEVHLDITALTTKPKVNDHVLASGISLCKPIGASKPIPLIKPRSQSDIVFKTPTLEEYMSFPVPAGKLRIFWLGQAGFLFKDGEGRKVLVDPYLSDYAAQNPPNTTWVRLVPVPIPPENVQPHLTLCTHDHNDHLDPWTIAPIYTSSDSFFIGPTSSYNHFGASDIGIPEARRAVLNRGETTTWNDIQISAVYANHTTDSVGFVITMAGRKIYISGDTCFDSTLVNAVQAAQPDIMIVSINGKFDNLTADEAAQLVKACEPYVDVTIPMHYGMFAVNTEDPQVFVDACATRGVTAQVIVMEFATHITL